MVKVTDLWLQDGCLAWVHNFELASPEELKKNPELKHEQEQEQRLITDLANAIAHGFKLIGVPGFLLEVEEINHTKSETTMHFKIGQTTPEGVSTLGMMLSKTLFETTARQSYHATNHDHSELDYDGELKMSITLSGVWDKDADCYSQDGIAEVALKLATGYYYEKILKHYPEWSTDYKDAPIMVTAPVDHL